jgi:hypothetical protein
MLRIMTEQKIPAAIAAQKLEFKLASQPDQPYRVAIKWTENC